ncbi:MAG: hypothetical protein V1673_01040 [Candidatus Omnitrophota bacterium]
MFLKEHILAGVVAAAAVSWYVSPQAGISVLAGSVLIDVDHFLWYAVKFKDGSLKRAIRFFEAKEADHYYCLCVLHTVEVTAVYIAGVLFMHGAIFWISAGCVMHVALDVVQGILDRGLFRRKWSLIHAILLRARGG